MAMVWDGLNTVGYLFGGEEVKNKANMVFAFLYELWRN